MSLAAVAVLIAALSFAVALFSLMWQIVGFRLSGVRVKATMTLAVLAHTNEYMPSILDVRAWNSGRQAVALTGFTLQPEGSDVRLFVTEKFPGNPDLPHTLEPGHDVHWSFAKEIVDGYLAEKGASAMALRGVVSLGTGTTVLTQPVDVSPGPVGPYAKGAE